MSFSTFGRHVVLDMWGVGFEKLNNLDFLVKSMKEAVCCSLATILSVQSQSFLPQGVTVLIMLSESHFSIHTYPEKGFAALDCYTCGYTTKPIAAINHMIEVLEPKKRCLKVLQRGLGEIEVVPIVGDQSAKCSNVG